MFTVNAMLTTIFCFFLLCFPFLCSARDNITWKSSITDQSPKETLVSAGGRFELGFFAPNGSRRYVGIWYYKSNPRTVVWVANRQSPLGGSDGVFAIGKDGNAVVLDGNNKSYWSTSSSTVQARNSSYTNRMLKLLDSGNLVLLEENGINNTVIQIWQSFENPTDTFLPGMKMDTNRALTSWKSIDDPSPGYFTFQQDQDGQNHYSIRKEGSILFWQSKVSGDFIASNDDELLLALVFSEDFPSEKQDMRLVMDHSGKILYYIAVNGTTEWSLLDKDQWDLHWWEPRNRCSVYNACGNFGSCNSRTKSLCKCLPGFRPKSPNKWNSRDFSDGCEGVSSICDENVGSDDFLSLKMMKVGKPKDIFHVSNESDCANGCLLNCNCQAYSYAENARHRYDNQGKCYIWWDLDNLWENFTGGRDLSVRVAASYIGTPSCLC
jgi:hypothetical protein